MKSSNFFLTFMITIAAAGCGFQPSSSDSKQAANTHPLSCANFSGNWAKVACSGQDAASIHDQAVINQQSCNAITLEQEQFQIGAATQEIEGTKYFSSWDGNLYPNLDHLRIAMYGNLEGIAGSFNYFFVQAADGQQDLKLVQKRTFLGETETLVSCTFKKVN